MSESCTGCGHVNVVGSKFCSSCGRALSGDGDVSTEALETLGGIDGTVDMQAPPSGAVLVVTSGHQAGTRYVVASEQLTVGRHPDSDIFLDDITVSRRHVELKVGSTGYVISDVGSLNGTYLNGERLEETEAVLTNGDELQIGKFKLLYLVSSTN
ncbi:MAG: hypothetical protein CL520_04940 [Actinobacteria bacterium]|uniref:FHA domain-containing protein n=1 Tax=marine metagenome TaxID=408172 RepID=A0A381PG04_9ZZZZ|nr:hypothetical protein [Actinomycetota bacterium]MED5551746.1 FHA domain-containing protein [Actinomycetota bacterium]MEE3188084.1 FHA domain-containing protein [Actinomycetota bacterium]